MKRQLFSSFTGIAAIFLALSAQAHEPGEHMKDAEQPDCAAMKVMDHSKMDMDDPVMQAMMQRCMDEMHQDETGSDASHADHAQQDEHGSHGSHAGHGKNDEKAKAKKPDKYQN